MRPHCDHNWKEWTSYFLIRRCMSLENHFHEIMTCEYLWRDEQIQLHWFVISFLARESWPLSVVHDSSTTTRLGKEPEGTFIIHCYVHGLRKNGIYFQWYCDTWDVYPLLWYGMNSVALHQIFVMIYFL